jgi:hypothetical protein
MERPFLYRGEVNPPPRIFFQTGIIAPSKTRIVSAEKTPGYLADIAKIIIDHRDQLFRAFFLKTHL